jgi:hypothetical protein
MMYLTSPAHAPLLTWQQPPLHAVAQYPMLAFLFGGVLAVTVTAIGAVYAVRHRSALWLACAISGLILYPLVVEPTGDYFVAVWYPTNHEIAATMFGRPMPWFVVFAYLAGIPSMTVYAYSIAKRSTPRKLLLILGVFTVAEVGFEAVGNHLQWMIYYANPATIFNVPIYCLTQNGGFLAGIVWVLAWLLPRTHGWRWILVPFAVAATLPTWALATTWPAYLAIYLGASAPVIWAGAIVSTVLNAALALWCAYSPQLRRLCTTEEHTPQPGAHRVGLSGVA